MNSITEQILHDVNELPVDMQSETLDFIKFLKMKLERQQVVGNKSEIEKNQRKQAIGKILERMAQRNALAEIKDPVAWQKKLREDRSLPGRED
ncbi:MAG: hypothetical protein HQM11_13685 [SAR324 cluster bacterium]|nr:hypothetical protein [SAR324 cluster bacterium]